MGSLPESLTQGLLVGQLLVGGLGVIVEALWLSEMHVVEMMVKPIH